MDKFMVYAPPVVWVIVEIIGKFVLPKLDKKVLAVVVAALTSVVAFYSGLVGGGVAVVSGVVMGPVVGLLHDKLIEPVLILGKDELKKS